MTVYVYVQMVHASWCLLSKSRNKIALLTDTLSPTAWNCKQMWRHWGQCMPLRTARLPTPKCIRNERLLRSRCTHCNLVSGPSPQRFSKWWIVILKIVEEMALGTRLVHTVFWIKISQDSGSLVSNISTAWLNVTTTTSPHLLEIFLKGNMN